MAWLPDPANPGWLLLEGGDPQQDSSWWQIPEGFVADPNNPGWYYREGSDVSLTENWVHDPSIADPEPEPQPQENWFDPIYRRAQETFDRPTKYEFGGDRIEGYSHGPWDCAGWIMEIFDAASPPIDIAPGHTQGNTNAERLRQACDPISEEEATYGDLVFFRDTYPTAGASHVGIVWDPATHIMGDNHERQNGVGPGLTSWDEPYWRSHLMGFGRVRRPFDSRPGAIPFWTADEVAQAAGVSGANGKNVEQNWPLIAAAMDAWEIADPLVGIGIIGTIAKESSSFAPVREAWWLSDAARWAYYNDTTKHAPYGGGAQYHGRGFVQLTHRTNYEAAQSAINERTGWQLDLASNPDQALDAEVAAQAICWFFLDKGLVPLCQARNWREVRRRVWGAYGDTDGEAKLTRAEAMLLPIAQMRGYA